MFSIYKNNKKISGACRSFVLCLDYVAISPFIDFKGQFKVYLINDQCKCELVQNWMYTFYNANMYRPITFYKLKMKFER